MRLKGATDAPTNIGHDASGEIRIPREAFLFLGRIPLCAAKEADRFGGETEVSDG